jgi:hypothetical protein
MAARAPLKLDSFPHIFPRAYFERMKAIAAGNPVLAKQGLSPRTSTPGALAALGKAETEKWARLIHEANIKAD